MSGGVCHMCGDTVDALYRHGETGGVTVAPFLVCAPCGGLPVCGDCSPDMGVFFDEWPDAVDSGADLVPCVQCGNGGQA